MYEQAIAHLRIKEPQKEKMQIYIDVPIRRTLDEIQKKEGVTFTAIINSALRVFCEEYYGLKSDLCTFETTVLYKMLQTKEDELSELLADEETEDGFEYRGYYFSNNPKPSKQKTDILIDQIERLKKELNIEDEHLIYKGDI